MASVLPLAVKQLRRDWSAGELRVLVAALIIAVAGLSSVNFFTDRIEAALSSQANELLGGDLLMQSRDPISEQRRRQAQDRGLDLASTTELPTMVMAGGEALLVGLKAVSADYPLKGRHHISSGLFGLDFAVDGPPALGSVWADSRLLTTLGLNVGDHIQIGYHSLQLSGVLITEPSQSGGMVFNIAPRVIMRQEDLAATQLIQPGSRVGYRLLAAGEKGAVAALHDQWQASLQPNERLMTIRDARPEVRTALERGERFLGLAALVAVLLAGVAVAMATRRFVERHLDHCAVMRCLGASQSQISRIYLYEMLILGLAACSVGILLGYLVQFLLVEALGTLINIELAPSGWRPVLLGFFAGMLTLLGFAIPPLMQLKYVPPLRVLRRELSGVPISALSVYGAGAATFIGLVLMQSQSLKLAAITLVGLAGLLLLLMLLAYLLLLLIKRLPLAGRSSWRMGLANISRRSRQSILQMAGFGIGLMALLLLVVVRGDLLDEWHGKLPDDTPNRFLINIQPQQLDEVQRFFHEQGISPRFYPMVRARLTEINSSPVLVENFATERGRRLARREFNLSWSATVPEQNEIIAGAWWPDRPPVPTPAAEFSLEEGIAEELNLKLGDTLTYEIGGSRVTATVTSLRGVKWDTFNANFFVMAPPGLLDHFPATYISGFYLAPEQQALLNDLVEQFPNITVLDVAVIIDQVRTIIERVTLAVEYVFVFTLIAGLLVMYATILATLDERVRDAAIMRTLGARRGRLLTGLVVEYAGLGLLSGLVAALAAGGAGMVIARQLFDLEYLPGPTLWLAGTVVGVVGIGVAGVLGTRKVINQAPLKTLRG